MVMLEMGGGSKYRGRPRRRWLDRGMEATGLCLKDVVTDRNGWREGWSMLSPEVVIDLKGQDENILLV